MKEKIVAALCGAICIAAMGAIGYLGYVVWVLAEIIGKLR